MIRSPYIVDNTDWLKTAAILLVFIDHLGYFFIENADWWSVVGRLAAPPFFFLIGYAKTRSVPLLWIWLGIILTLLDSWNMDWSWVAPNILLSLALIRLARPKVQVLMQRRGWPAFVLLVLALLAVQPYAANIVEYGSEGWLWALFGLTQRMYVDSRSIDDRDVKSRRTERLAHAMPGYPGLLRLLACFVAAVVYLWQEQMEFQFSGIQFAAVILGIGLLSSCLCLFQRGPSHIQPSQFLSSVLHFLGRHTLEIYAIQLAGSEIIIGLMPQLAA